MITEIKHTFTPIISVTLYYEDGNEAYYEGETANRIIKHILSKEYG